MGARTKRAPPLISSIWKALRPVPPPSKRAKISFLAIFHNFRKFLDFLENSEIRNSNGHCENQRKKSSPVMGSNHFFIDFSNKSFYRFEKIWVRGRPLAAISKLSLGNPLKVSSRDRKWSLDHRESDQSSDGSIKTSCKSPELRCQKFESCRRPATGRNFEVESWKHVES